MEDKEVKQADFLSSTLADAMPKVPKPRTTNDPEAEEIWQLTLQDAIRIGLDNSEVVRVISFGAQGIPIGGFEPTPLNTGAGAGIASSLGAGTLLIGLRPGDPGDPDRPGPVDLRHQLHHQPALGPQRRSRSTTPSRAVRSASPGRSSRSSSIQDTAQFQIGLQKRTATGALLGDHAQRQLPLLEQPDLTSPRRPTRPTSSSVDPALAG